MSHLLEYVVCLAPGDCACFYRQRCLFGGRVLVSASHRTRVRVCAPSARARAVTQNQELVLGVVVAFRRRDAVLGVEERVKFLKYTHVHWC